MLVYDLSNKLILIRNGIVLWVLLSISYILIYLVCLFVTGLAKGVLCSFEFSIVGKTVTTNSE
jgi:hypothetical protein